MNVRNFRVGVKNLMGLARSPSEKIPADVLLKTDDDLLKTAEVLLKTADVLLKTADVHLKTADVLLKTTDVLLKNADFNFGVPSAQR